MGMSAIPSSARPNRPNNCLESRRLPISKPSPGTQVLLTVDAGNCMTCAGENEYVSIRGEQIVSIAIGRLTDTRLIAHF